LWFGIFGAPAAWALEVIAGYSVIAHYCYPRDSPLSTPTFDATRLTGFIVCVVLILVGLAALVTAIHSWRETRHGHDAEHHELLEVGEGRARFMAFGGVLLSTMFLFALIMSALPVFTNSLCMY
jgi:F0F1-type ATP synthase membrane subunit c/vacuolar-type H+-ATPase subunit K